MPVFYDTEVVSRLMLGTATIYPIGRDGMRGLVLAEQLTPIPDQADSYSMTASLYVNKQLH